MSWEGYNYEDAIKCFEYTGVDGVMSSESLLENPALFSGKVYDLDDMALEYLEICKQTNTDGGYIRPHLFKFLYTGLMKHTDLREKLSKAKTMEEYERIAKTLKERRLGEAPESKISWYMRYVPKEDRDAYNDYRISIKKALMIEEDKTKGTLEIVQNLEEIVEDVAGGTTNLVNLSKKIVKVEKTSDVVG